MKKASKHAQDGALMEGLQRSDEATQVSALQKRLAAQNEGYTAQAQALENSKIGI